MIKSLVFRLLLVILLSTNVLYGFTQQDNKRNFFREEINLNGEWELAISENNNKVPDTGWNKIRVPHISNINDKGVYWYRTDFYVPDKYKNGIVKLYFEDVSLYYEVYVNDKLCGTHMDLMVPYEVDITDAVKYGENNKLRIYLEDCSRAQTGNYGNKGRKFDMLIDDNSWIAGWKIKGITGNVDLRYYPLVYAEDTFIITSVRNKTLTVKTWIRNKDKAPHKIKINHRAIKDKRIEKETKYAEMEINPDELKEVEITEEWLNPMFWGIGEGSLRCMSVIWIKQKS